MFEDLKGNDEVKKLLKRVVSAGRTPQALIFAGPDGIGKKQFALKAAKSFVCVSLSEGLPCGKCSACIRSSEFKLPTSGKKEDYEQVYFSSHPDIGMVVPNKNSIYINAIRDLAAEANFRPYEGRARVFVIDEAEKLGLNQKHAANALLKTLEEPASTTYIFLITSKPSSLLQTIHSRCQMLRFSPVSSGEIVKHLLASQELSTLDAELAAKAAKGSIGRALRIDAEDYRNRRARLLEALRGLASRKGIPDALRVSNEISTQKGPDDFRESIELIESVVRDLLLLQRGSGENLSHPDLINELSELASVVGRDGPPLWIDEIEDLKSNLRFNLNKKIAADGIFVKIAAAY